MELCLHQARLPKPARFTKNLLPKSHALRTSGCDLNDFYYILEVDAERYVKNKVGPSVPQSWFGNLSDESLGDASTFEDWGGGADLFVIRRGVVGGGGPEPY